MRGFIRWSHCVVILVLAVILTGIVAARRESTPAPYSRGNNLSPLARRSRPPAYLGSALWQILRGTQIYAGLTEDVRDFSHGCIRVQQPADLVAWVLRNNPGWDWSA